MVTVVTGASRGIGLELARLLKARGDQVYAVCRTPTPELKQLKTPILQMDVSAPQVEEQLQDYLRSVEKVDLLINNAGIGTEMSATLRELSVEQVRQMWEVNTLGPLQVTRALLPYLARAQKPKIAHISSLMGSIGDNRGGQAYGYRMSKAALNAMNKSLSIDEPQLISVVFHPGWVQTDLGGPRAPLSAGDSARQLIAQIDQLEPSHSGHFYDYKGRELPW